MTLLDLCKLIRKYWRFVVGIPVLCAILCAAIIFVMPKAYKSETVITVSGDIASVDAIAKSQAIAESDVFKTDITTSTDTSSKTITITAAGKSSPNCVLASNITATTTCAATLTRYSGSNSNINLSVSNATKATKTTPGVPKSTLIAFLASMFVTICVIVIIDLARGILHSSADVEREYEIRHLGNVGRRRPEGAASNSSSEKAQHAGSTMNQEELLANVKFSADSNNTIAVVSACKGTKRAFFSSQTCLDLANAAKNAGISMLVIDADLREESNLSETLEAEGAKGKGSLIGVLKGEGDIVSAAVPVSDSVSFVRSGAPAENAVALLDSTNLAKALEAAKERFELVILNTSSPAMHSDFSYVSHVSSSTLVVVEEMATERKQMNHIARQLNIANANVIGFATIS